MFTRYRWYRVHFPRGKNEFFDLVSKQPLTQSSDFGFSCIEDGVDFPRLRFLWRTKVVVTRLDEDGTPSYEQIASVNFTDFSIITVDDQNFLRIENPSRNIRDLLNALELLAGIGFTAKPLAFEKNRPTTIFEHVEITKLIGLKVVGAVIDEDLVARMEFASKQGMIINNMKLLDGLNYKIESSVFEVTYEGTRGQVAFGSNGAIKVSGQLAPKLIHLIEKDLPNLFK